MKATAVRKALKGEKFPIKVRKDSVTVKIYRTSTRGYTSYTVAWSEDGQRKLKSFADLGDAKEAAEGKASELAGGERSGVFLTGSELHTYNRSIEIIAPFGKPLDVVAQEHAEALGLLQDRAGVVEVIRDWLKRNAVALPRISVTDAVKQLKEQAKTDRKSQDRRKQLAASLDRLAEAFNCEVHTLTPALVSDYLTALPFAERTKRNHRDALGFFFRWLVTRGYLPKGTDLLEGVQNYTARKTGEISIYTPDEIARLLGHADERLVPFLAIGAFAGLRHAEIARLDWSEIELTDGEAFIEVKASKAKTDVRRIVPVPDNLKAWLLPLRKESGKVCSFINITKQLLKLATDTKVQWKHNALRHSCISYRVADCGDVPRVSDESGNSPTVIRSNYLRRVKPAVAAKWFSITPASAENVINLATASAL